MKRKILSLILCCALLFSLAACGKTEAPQQREVDPGHYVVCHLYEK